MAHLLRYTEQRTNLSRTRGPGSILSGVCYSNSHFLTDRLKNGNFVNKKSWSAERRRRLAGDVNEVHLRIQARRTENREQRKYYLFGS